jgi:CBS domain-containing protein
MSDKVYIEDYMSEDVMTINYDSTVKSTINMIKNTGHDGYPVVCSGNKLVGYIRAKDLVTADSSEKIQDIMSTDQTVFKTNMTIKTAGRVMFREGISEAPVVDSSGSVIGLISNTDIIRSQIERTTPRKVEYLVEMFSELYDDIDIEVIKDSVNVKDLRPTQDKIYQDELIGRQYEIKNGLAEPIVVVRTPTYSLIADGHHRSIACSKISQESIEAYIIDIKQDIDIGLAQQSINRDLESLNDITIISDKEHPQIERIDIISEL